MATTKRQRVQFKERTELLDFLLEVSAVTAETLDLDRLLPAVADYVQRVIPHNVFAILLYNEKQHGLKIRYARGHRDEVVRSLVIPLGEGITGAAAASRHAIVVNDVQSDPRYLPALDAVRSELAVPMFARGKLVGVIDIQSTKLNSFSESDTSLLRLLAARVSSSIDNARLHRRIVTQNRTSRILTQLSAEFSSILQLNELLTKIAKAMRTLVNYDAFSVLLVDAEARCLRHRFSERYDERIDLDNIPLGKGITGAAAVQREIIRVDDIVTDPRYISSHPDIRSEVAVPLIVSDRVVGVMDLESERIAYFTEEHVRALTLLAPQIASSIENARLYEELAQREQRMEQDLKAARRVQSILLPREAPEMDGLDMAISSRAAREISGDLYDFFEQSEDTFVIAFGDSSGKGAAAALYGSLVSGLLRSLAPRMKKPAALMKRLNEILLERKVDAQYVTLTLMYWNIRTQELTLSNAGAIPPMICRDGERVVITAEGVPLGLLDDREYDEVTVQTKSGDAIVLFSDGVADQLNHEHQEYTSGRLFKALKAAAQLPAKELVATLFADLDKHTDGAPMTDDQTLIVAKVK
ncbi:MAG TPA: GAF domain-containing SpoIIE family protein phosphatase [Bryobacteraceae bacterium]|nr:GAF domain-containing SpoIIE family protein phosphatase [Bryobacteraceae bacterium]